MHKQLDLIGDLLGNTVLAMWTFGGFLGVVYWAVHGQMTYALFSVMVPLFGATTVILDVLRFLNGAVESCCRWPIPIV